jgi:hypothetical protein
MPSLVNQWYLAGSGAATGLGPLRRDRPQKAVGDLPPHPQIGGRQLLSHGTVTAFEVRIRRRHSTSWCPQGVGPTTLRAERGDRGFGEHFVTGSRTPRPKTRLRRRAALWFLPRAPPQQFGNPSGSKEPPAMTPGRARGQIWPGEEWIFNGNWFREVV